MIFNVPIKKYEEANSYQKRDCFKQLDEYLNNNSTKVCTLYGLRRTGKTTMMFQAMKDTGLENCGYILCEKGDTYKELCTKLDEYIKAGKKAVFIDEITKISNFLYTSASLADYYSGMGCKIIITGTDSLGLNLAARGELYDRVINIHTTYLSYGEFSKLTGMNDCDDFIHYAGVLSHESDVKMREFYDRSTASHYIDTAISDNITNTFFNKNLPQEFIHKFNKLIGLHNENILIPVITCIVEMYSGIITRDTLNAYFKQLSLNMDISSALDLLERHGVFINRDDFDDNFEAQIAFALNQKRYNVYIDEDTVNQIKEYLYDLELMVKIPLIRYSSNNLKKPYTYETEEYIYQAGMKYCQAKNIIDIIKNNNDLNMSPIEKNSLCTKIEEDIKGQILEVNIFNDIQNLLNSDRYDAFKWQFTGSRDGEIDIVIQDKINKFYYCFEVKHSDKIEPQQQKNLVFKPYLDILSANYGLMKDAIVLYRGDTTILENGIEYINADDFLTEMYKSNDKNLDKIISSCIKKGIQNSDVSLKNKQKSKNMYIIEEEKDR